MTADRELFLFDRCNTEFRNQNLQIWEIKMNIEKNKKTGLKLLICSISMAFALQTAQVIGNCGVFCDDQIEFLEAYVLPPGNPHVSYCYKFYYRWEHTTFTQDSIMTVQDPAFPATRTTVNMYDKTRCQRVCYDTWIPAANGVKIKSVDSTAIMPVLATGSEPDYRCSHASS